MIVFHNPDHALHSGRVEMFRGQLVPCFEVPARVDHVLDELRRAPVGELSEGRLPDAALLALLARVHSPRYLDFLRGAWDEWLALDAANAAHDILPSYWPAPGMRRDLLPASFAARVGLFAFDAGSPITAGTWPAALRGAACAADAARALLEGQRGAFALTRPPGHHAGRDFYGGYSFLNNAAICAQALLDGGLARVAVLDVDYHHGNGTQDIFCERDDVFFASLHGDPRTEYPYYLGHADERGVGAGLGFNLNLPLPRGTGFARWREALAQALAAIAAVRPQALVVSLGVDTFAGDPISGFGLAGDDYLRMGEDLAAAGLPVAFVFEGGYAVAEVGVNTVSVLRGFLGAAG